MPIHHNKAAAYLNAYFVEAKELCQRWDMSQEEFLDRTNRGALPQPSYTVTQSSSQTSAIFGNSSATISACYYPRTMLTQSLDEFANVEDFLQGYRDALTAWLATYHPANFTADPKATYQHWLQGTYGICVVDPRSPERIAGKQVTIAMLNQLANHYETQPTPSLKADLAHLAALCDDFEMPFAPWDYHKSSRCRTLDPILHKTSPGPLYIQPLATEDVPDLLKIRISPAQTAYSCHGSELLQYWDDPQRDLFGIWLRGGFSDYQKDELVGFFYLYHADQMMQKTYHLEQSLTIRALSIAAPYQRRGLGQTAMTKLIGLMPRIYPGMAHLSLTVSRDNTPAQGLYRSVGFETHEQPLIGPTGEPQRAMSLSLS